MYEWCRFWKHLYGCRYPLAILWPGLWVSALPLYCLFDGQQYDCVNFIKIKNGWQAVCCSKAHFGKVLATKRTLKELMRCFWYQKEVI